MSKLILFLDGPHRGSFLSAYDPDYANGRGLVEATDDPSRALRFASTEAAMQAWKLPSVVRPLRPDGRPNRPLSAWTVSIFNDDPETIARELMLVRTLSD